MSESLYSTLSKNVETDVLGHLFWYSIGEVTITRGELSGILNDAGLSDMWLPRPIRPVDAFRRATYEVQDTKHTSDQKKHHNFLIREAYYDKKMVQRNVIVETVDQDQKVLDYNPQAAIFYLNKKDGDFQIDKKSNIPEIRDICQKAIRLYHLYRDCYTSHHLRLMVYSILESLAPIPMRQDGNIYFIPVHAEVGLSQLTHFINSISVNEAFQVLCISTDSNRLMIQQKMLDKLDHLYKRSLKNKELRKDQIKNLQKQIQDIINDFSYYREILGEVDNNLENRIKKLEHEIYRINLE